MRSKRGESHEGKDAYAKWDILVKVFIPNLFIMLSTFVSIFLSNHVGWQFVFVALIAYAVAVIISFITTACMIGHYNNKHGNPTACREAITDNCSKLETCSGKYEEIADRLNTKVLEQEKSFEEIEKFIKNAKKLKTLYTEAVGKMLRTNADLIEIERRVKDDSTIYIMTAKFVFEIYDKEMRKTIAENILRGVKYRYIIPDDEAEEEFKKMVYVIMAEMQEQNKNQADVKFGKENDYITAVKIPEMYCMLTIVYYELEDDEVSSVIVKLPASNMDEKNEQEAFAYKIPGGQVLTDKNRKKYYPEHKEFLDNMNKICRDINKKVILSKTELAGIYSNGVKVSMDASESLHLK